MTDKNNWAEANRNRDYWGTKNYKADMDFSHCKQSEPNDKHGTPEEVRNACFYYWDKMKNRPEDMFLTNSISLLMACQQGLSSEKFKHIKFLKPERIKVGTAQEIANTIHHSLDWLRATNKRLWDDRPLNSMEQMLESAIKGHIVNEYNELHYDERAER